MCASGLQQAADLQLQTGLEGRELLVSVAGARCWFHSHLQLGQMAWKWELPTAAHPTDGFRPASSRQPPGLQRGAGWTSRDWRVNNSTCAAPKSRAHEGRSKAGFCC